MGNELEKKGSTFFFSGGGGGVQKEVFPDSVSNKKISPVDPFWKDMSPGGQIIPRLYTHPPEVPDKSPGETRGDRAIKHEVRGRGAVYTAAPKFKPVYIG